MATAEELDALYLKAITDITALTRNECRILQADIKHLNDQYDFYTEHFGSMENDDVVSQEMTSDYIKINNDDSKKILIDKRFKSFLLDEQKQSLASRIESSDALEAQIAQRIIDIEAE